MGTGKTTVGQRVAKSLGYAFVDTDELIAQKAGMSIPEIFATHGEDYFRELETAALDHCCQTRGQVISTGGGIVVREPNRQLLKTGGYVIWLKASADVIYERIKRSKERPLVQTEDPLDTIKRMLKERNSFYKESKDLSIVTDDLTVEETIYGVTESARLALR